MASQTELYPVDGRSDARADAAAMPPAQTIAEGIAVKQPGALTTADRRKALVDGHPSGRARTRSNMPWP